MSRKSNRNSIRKATGEDDVESSFDVEEIQSQQHPEGEICVRKVKSAKMFIQECSNGYEESAAEVRNNPEKQLVRYKEIPSHLVFDIKLDGK